MSKVKVTTRDLLDKLRNLRRKQQAKYRADLDAFRQEVHTTCLRAMTNSNSLTEDVPRIIAPVAPTKYDAPIAMLELCAEETVEFDAGTVNDLLDEDSTYVQWFYDNQTVVAEILSAKVDD